MNLTEIQDLIKFVSKSGVSEVEIEQKDFKIVIKAENKSKKEEHTVYVPAFANVGDSIEKGKVVCIIEAMKLFNDIESEISGKIVKVLVDDASPVEYDQPLFLVDPA